MSQLIENLINNRVLKTERIIRAFKKIKRIDFLQDNLKFLAELDKPLPIGCGQTISQPSVVAFMLELLSPKQGEKVLDIGSGSGWTTALLAEIVSQNNEQGRVFSIEIIPEILKFGKKNTEKYNFVKKGIVEFVCADGAKGYPDQANFDKILVSASAQKIPLSLKQQLKINGKLVCPVKNSIFLIEKDKEKSFKEVEYPGFIFVPLVHT